MKEDAVTGAPLAGAVFILSNPSTGSQSIVTGGSGRGRAVLRTNVQYSLTETTPPAGYQPDATIYTILIDIFGQLLVNGVPVRGLRIENQPIRTAGLSFIKSDSVSGAPLEGAVFTLSQNGVPTHTATSNAAGLVSFGGLSAGIYVLAETTPPVGYLPNSAVYTVSVSTSGEITIDGQPASLFSVENEAIERSPIPEIDDVIAADTVVSGMGNPGCSITVYFPDGATSTTTVQATGRWFATVPAGETLVRGDYVYADQTCPGMLTSERVSITVSILNR